MLHLGKRIHTAFLEGARTGAIEQPEHVVARLRDLGGDPDERDRLWTMVIEGYQQDSAGPWAAALLEAIRTELDILCATLPLAEPFVDRDDLANQLVVEVLAVARTERSRTWSSSDRARPPSPARSGQPTPGSRSRCSNRTSSAAPA